MEELFLVLAVALGLLTAWIAGRYDRPAVAWGIAGTPLAIVALPLLLILGPADRKGTHRQLANELAERPEAVEILRVLTEEWLTLGRAGRAFALRRRDSGRPTGLALG